MSRCLITTTHVCMTVGSQLPSVVPLEATEGDKPAPCDTVRYLHKTTPKSSGVLSPKYPRTFLQVHAYGRPAPGIGLCLVAILSHAVMRAMPDYKQQMYIHTTAPRQRPQADNWAPHASWNSRLCRALDGYYPNKGICSIAQNDFRGTTPCILGALALPSRRHSS